MSVDQLPYLDEHTTLVEAAADHVWAVPLDHLERSFPRPGAARYARGRRGKAAAAGRVSGERA